MNTLNNLLQMKRLIDLTAHEPTAYGRPKAALLFWFLGDFRCGVPLFIVIHVIYNYKKWVKIDVNC